MNKKKMPYQKYESQIRCFNPVRQESVYRDGIQAAVVVIYK